MNAVYLQDSGVGFIVGETGTILKSTDAGQTWATLTSGTTKTLYDLYFFDDNIGLVVGETGLILRTTDGGNSWQTVPSHVRDALRSVSFSGSNGICGATSQTLLYSDDFGLTWVVAQSGFFGGGFFGAHMLSSSQGFVAGENSIFQPMLGVTSDGGSNWDFHVFYFNGNEGNADDVFFFDQNTGLLSGVLWDGEGAISRTTDGGINWTTLLYDQGMQGIDFPQSNAGFVVGWGGRIVKSTDEGITWSEQPSGTSLNLIDVHFETNALTGLAVGDGGTILRTTNGGESNTLIFESAFSAMGPWDIPLPLDGSGVEDRSGGREKKYSIHLVFNNSLASVSGATSSCGAVASVTINQANNNEVVVNLAGVTCNESKLTVTALGIVDLEGGTLTSAPIDFGLLIGDVNGDGAVDHADYRIVKGNLGQTADSGNFRSDIATSGHNTTGYINNADLNLVKRQQGTHLLP